MQVSRIVQRVAVFGDSYGLPITIRNLPIETIKCVVCAKIRPSDFSNIEKIAKQLNVPLLVQPKVKDSEYCDFAERIEQVKPDLIICNSYSMIIRDDILSKSKFGGVNVHQSLLPKNRGPNPIQWSLIRGETETGVTVHFINERIDSGDIIGQEKIQIADLDTWVTLRGKLTHVTDLLLKKHIPMILTGAFARRSQIESEATQNKRLCPESPRIDFRRMSDVQIFNLIRAQVTPLKGAFIELSDRRIYLSSFKTLEEVKELRMQFQTRTTDLRSSLVDDDERKESL